eukprot:COSAG02_NODE_20_length_53673_cov_86.864841_21_plen_50_part_00
MRKPLTGKQKYLVQAKKHHEPIAEHREVKKQIQEALKSGERLELTAPES